MTSILDEVKDGDLVAHWGEERVPIGGEEQVSLTIDSPQKVGELREVSERLSDRYRPRTLKSVFIVVDGFSLDAFWKKIADQRCPARCFCLYPA